jgi:hypothetical protein
MRRPWLLAAALAVAAVAVVAIALLRDDSTAEAVPVGFPNNPEGRKPLIFDVGLVAGASSRPALQEAHSLGADAIRVLVPWNRVAPVEKPADFRPADPLDPNYNFDSYDGALRAIARLGMRIVLSPAGPAPEWASKPRTGGLADPDPEQFGEFVSALAKRYGGRFRIKPGAPTLPRADIWAIWNEPNLSIFLQPQMRDGRPYSPLLYRELYLAAQRAIHDQTPDAPILIGETAPTGGLDGVNPLTFTRQTLCLSGDFEELPRCPQPDDDVDAVGWSAHPYPLAGQAPFRPVTNPHFVTMSSLSALELTLDGASGADKLASDFPLYITEFGVQSFPDPNAVSLQQQAGYIAISEHFAYNDPRVATFAQYLLNDDSPNAIPGELYGGFESGLRFFDGDKKPAYDAFRLPLAVQRLGGAVSVWGLVQPYPHPTTVKIRFKNPGQTPKNLQSVATNEVGVFTTTYGDFPERLWQAVWHSPLDGHTYRSPWIRSYEFAAPQ